jgi:hypothetical protein
LSQLPIPGGTAGVVSIHQSGSSIGIPYDNFGPILVDGPDLVGKGNLFAAFSYQHFNFNAIDGINLGSLPVGFTYTIGADGADPQIYFNNTANNINFKLDQTVALLTYGASRKTDISIIIPINVVSLSVTTSNYRTYFYDTASKTYTDESIPPGSPDSVRHSAGSASGVGDVIFNAKQLLYGAEGSRLAVAVGLGVRFATGDAMNYLGSGSYGAHLYGTISYRARTSPHFRLGNQWNSSSVLVNTSKTAQKALPGGIEYDLGVDRKVFRNLDVAVDFLGNQFVNTPSLTSGFLTPNPPKPATGTAPAALAAVAASTNTYTTANISTGLKWAPLGRKLPTLLVYGNVLIQLNNVGLRSDPVPLAGISYNFRRKQQ